MTLLDEKLIGKITTRPEQVSNEQYDKLLSAIQFDDPDAARSIVQRMVQPVSGRRLYGKILPVLLISLQDAGHPDRAFRDFDHFIASHEIKNDILRVLANEPRMVEMLIMVFAGSQFLGDILLRYPEYFEQIRYRKSLTQPKTKQQFYTAAIEAVKSKSEYNDRLEILRLFQRRELFRIGAADLFGMLDLQSITTQLSQLAFSLIQVCLDIAAEDIKLDQDGFAIIALGKLGGRELNYSSDIDLLFLAKNSDQTYQRLGQRVIDAIDRATSQGFLYRVDMRLRPWGQTGKLVPSVAENLNYLNTYARTWEIQALFKGRFIAGDEKIGISFLQEIKPIIYKLNQAILRDEIRQMKKEIETNLKKKRQEWGQVKSGKGSIRDVEFVTQYLQLIRGLEHPEIRSRNTLDGLARLAASDILPARDYRVLSDGYIFLRTVEHYLQIMHNRQIHQLPQDKTRLVYLAKRLGFEGDNLDTLFLERYSQHSTAIRSVYRAYLGRKKDEKTIASGKEQAVPSVSQLASIDKTYNYFFNADDIRLHEEMAGRLSEENLVQIDVLPQSQRKWRITIVGYDYLGELSLICGLMFVYGLNIENGQIFTQTPAEKQKGESKSVPLKVRQRKKGPRKNSYTVNRPHIIDVFTVTSVNRDVADELWLNYAEELNEMLKRSKGKQHREVQGELAKRVAMAIAGIDSDVQTLLPVEIDIDNSASDEFTVLRIDATDTLGFLYELTNALSLNGINIMRVAVSSIGYRIHDTLFVTDSRGHKITAPQSQQQLRATTVLVKHFTHLLPTLPNPESALLHFHEFVARLVEREEWTRDLASIERPEVLEALARLLGVSDFLWQDFLRMQHTNLFPVVEDLQSLDEAKTKAVLAAEMNATIANGKDLKGKKQQLNAFKDREMFRIDMRYIQGRIPEFWLFAAELTHLGEVVLEAAYSLCYDALKLEYGTPMLAEGIVCPVCVCALGKFGGREIGFASDIELMFLFSEEGETSGPSVITNAEFMGKLVHDILQTIKAKREGIFELDLRMRPYGKASSLGVTLDAFKRYFSADGPAWDYERQALVRMRPLLGDRDFGREVTDLRDVCVYTGKPFDVRSMRGMRQKQVRQLVSGGTINAKFSPGALVDLEYLVQGLQISYGYELPELRLQNTGTTLAALFQVGIISTRDYIDLRDALDFLRRLIQGLRVVRGNARDLTVPAIESDEYAFLARRLGYEKEHLQLVDDLNRTTSKVQTISQRLLG